MDRANDELGPKRLNGSAITFSVLACCVTALLAMAPAGMLAHHGAASYDLNKSTTLKGTVTSFDWSNPHCLLHFDATNDRGEVRHWTIELFNPLWLERVGWKQNSLNPGDPITITFHPARDGAPNGYIRDSDGKLSSNGKAFRFRLAGDGRIK